MESFGEIATVCMAPSLDPALFDSEAERMQFSQRASTEGGGVNRDDSTWHGQQGPQVSRAGKDEQRTTHCVVRNQDVYANEKRHWDVPEELIMGQKKQKAKRGQEMATKSTESYRGRVSKSISKHAVRSKSANIFPATTPKLDACKELQQAWSTDLLGSPDTLQKACSNALSTSMRVRGSEGVNKNTGGEQGEDAVSFQNPTRQAAATPTSAISRDQKRVQPTSECQWQLPLAEAAQQQQQPFQSGSRTGRLHSPDIPDLRPAPRPIAEDAKQMRIITENPSDVLRRNSHEEGVASVGVNGEHLSQSCEAKSKSEQGMTEQAAEKYYREHVAMSQSANISAPAGRSLPQGNPNQTCFRKERKQLRATKTDAAGGTDRIRRRPQGGYMGQVGCFGPFLFGKRESGRTTQKSQKEGSKTQAQVIPDELETLPLDCGRVVFVTPKDLGACSSTTEPMYQRSACAAYRKNSAAKRKSSRPSVNAKAGPWELVTMT